MVDKGKLEDVIRDSGIKRKTLARKLGISDHALSNKINNTSEFKVSEVLIMEEALHLSLEETRDIFFKRNVDFNSTYGECNA